MIYLVAPDPASFTSGGNRFNQQILNGLSFLGYSCKRIEFSEVDESVSLAGNSLIFDSLFITRLSIHELNKIKAQKIFLIHLLPSMLQKEKDLSLEQKILACFDLIIANSEFTRNYCVQKLGITQNIETIQPFIETKQDGQTGIQRNKFIHVSNWVPEKQIDLFFIELSRHKLPDGLSIYFYGDLHRLEEYFKYCSSFLDEHPYLIKHIHLEGPLLFPMLQEVYANADLLVDTSSMETYGMVVAEAISHGVSVISLGNGNTINLVNNYNGLVCKNMEELVTSMIRHYQGDLSFDKPEPSHIITDWTQFSDQLKQILWYN